ncbi:hypothetical protein [Pedobacter sp. SYSU D00535]|uniref:baeRF7 domain-containing protein n=1 Tax=Pedobacter sp. SYSU D00535 TaxID=2810308 RepID=UPI001A95DBE8|nr:hypothetical protein [Pedobacter sp. SYSU D00535]
MEIISKEEFTELANYQSDVCISIYIPTHAAGIAVNERYDTIVFKNNVQRAKVELNGKGIDPREVDTLLAPAFELVRDEEFWNQQLQGLAVFISKGFFKIFKLPLTVKEELLVNSSFLLTPLLPVMERRHKFYLLVLSKKDCKFYECDQFEMKKLEVEGLPYNIDDVVPFEQKERRQTHRRAGAGAGGAAIVGANFHGHGTGLSDEEEYLEQYFKEVDQTLWTEVLHNQHVPLVIAAVEYEAALYRQISNYKHISDVTLTGNYEHEDRQSIYLKVKERMAPYFKEYVNDALKNFYNNSTTQLSSSVPSEVVPAAYYAQVSDLFVEKNQHLWGTFNEKDNVIEIHDEKREGDDCLINKAIIKTIMNGGEVHMLDKEKMPVDQSPIAAFLRFAM